MEAVLMVKKDDLHDIIEEYVQKNENRFFDRFYNRFISPKLCAELHGVSYPTIMRYIQDGKIPVDNHIKHTNVKIRLSVALQLDFAALKRR